MSIAVNTSNVNKAYVINSKLYYIYNVRSMNSIL